MIPLGIIASSSRRSSAGANDPHWDKVVALLHFDGDLVDETGLGTYTKSGTGDVSFSSEGYFEGCVVFDSSTKSNITTDNTSAWYFGNQDFTIEMFLHLTKPLANRESILGSYGEGGPTSSFLLAHTTAVGLFFDFREDNVYVPGVRYTGTVPVGEWFHLAITREGSVFRMFLHGVLVGMGTSTETINFPSQPLKIGGGLAVDYNSFQGKMDELRVTTGLARYTENFTPPTEPFPNQ